MATKRRILSLIFALSLICPSCSTKEEKKPEKAEKTIAAGTPVTVTSISTEPLVEYVELNATSAFLQKSYVKANVNGYITKVMTEQGKFVGAGQQLFTVKTREATSIGDAVDKLDPGFKFTGVNQIKAGSTGYITQINHLKGDYVQDGEQLAVISDMSSFVFILNLPYELKKNVNTGNILNLLLADGTEMKATVTGSMPTVDPAAQTQNIILKIAANQNIPENLIARVRVPKFRKEHSVTVPRAAVLTNDAQTDFWIMKVTDSTTAVKVPIKKGAETRERVEILEPKLDAADKILLTGNFGLPDTAKIVIGQ